jgi:hypothetical protein
MALGVVFDEASDVPVRDVLADFGTAVALHRAGLYGNFVEAAGGAHGHAAHVWSVYRPKRAPRGAAHGPSGPIPSMRRPRAQR